LQNAPQQKIHHDLSAFQATVDQVVNAKAGTYNNVIISTTTWFELMHFFSLLTRKICVASTNTHQELRDALKLSTLRAFSRPPKDRMEVSRIQDRQTIMSGIAAFMGMDLTSLRKILRRTKSTRQGFCPKGVTPPEILRVVFEELPDNSHHCKRKPLSKAASVMPTPRYLVQKRMDRLVQLMQERER